MSEEDKVRRAEIIAQRRQNRTDSIYKNNDEKRKMSYGSKISIQILISICIFGIFYFLSDNYSFAIEKIKPFMLNDTNFQQIYWEINGAFEKFKNNDSNNNNNNEEEQNIVNETKNNEPQKQNKNEVTNGVGGGDENIKESKTEDDITYIKTHAHLSKPLEGVVTSQYGHRTPTEMISENHAGIDIGVAEGTPILSAMDGVVEFVSSEGGYGNHIKISNGEISTLYAHCSKILVEQGARVEKGQQIAEAGATGNATGPHLHFEIRRNDVTVNPQDILEF